MPLRLVRRFRSMHYQRKLFYAWVIVFSLAVGYGFRVQREQTNDIQHSRVISCQATYEGIRQVFKPFKRPPSEQTQKEKDDWAKFNKIIDNRKRLCVRIVNQATVN